MGSDLSPTQGDFSSLRSYLGHDKEASKKVDQLESYTKALTQASRDKKKKVYKIFSGKGYGFEALTDKEAKVKNNAILITQGLVNDTEKEVFVGVRDQAEVLLEKLRSQSPMVSKRDAEARLTNELQRIDQSIKQLKPLTSRQLSPGKRTVYRKIFNRMVQPFSGRKSAGPSAPDAYNTDELRGKIEKPLSEEKKLADVVSEDSLLETVVVDSIHTAHDPNKVLVTKEKPLRGGVEGGVLFTLNASAATRKGLERLPVPKAMSEDACILGEVEVQLNEQTHHVPLMITMDGGGGHHLAQYGQAHLKDAFQKHLQGLVKKHGEINSFVLSEAASKANDQLFSQDIVDNQLTGEAYRALEEGHQKVQEDLGMPHGQLKSLFGATPQKVNPLEKKNPLERHQYYQESLKKDDRGEEVKAEDYLVKTPNRDFELTKKEDAEQLQHYYALALGTQQMITLQVVLNAFHADEQGNVICTTYNRGDSIAFASSGADGKLTALSEPVSAANINTSSMIVSDEDRVTSCCDGHREKISLEDQQAFDQKPEVLSLGSQDYVETVVKASEQVGGGDDVTVVSGRVKSGWS